MANMDIKAAAKSANVCLWQVAEEIGITDYKFSRRLRHELSETEKAKVLAAIEKIGKEQEVENAI